MTQVDMFARFGMMAGVAATAMGIGIVMQNGDSAHLAAMYANPAMAQTNPIISALPLGPQSVEPTTRIASAPNVLGEVSPLDAIPKPLQPLIAAQVSTTPDQTSAPMQPSLGLSGIQMTSSDAGVSQIDTTGAKRVTPSIRRQFVAPAAPSVSPVDCTPTLSAAVGEAAMITVSLSAPCHRAERVTVHHEGLMFTIRTDDRGAAQTVVPALKVASVVMASFGDGTSAVTDTLAPGLMVLDRAVLQWKGSAELEIHAFEKGAGYNEDGHIWKGAPGSLAELADGTGGHLIKLGSPDVVDPLFAEVYTFPTGLAETEGMVPMNVEAEVSRVNCEREVAAQTLQFSPRTGVQIQDLNFNLPTCQAIGEFLVLNNLLQPIQLAQR